MDTSNPAVFVNGDLLRTHTGKRVRALIQVVRPDNGSVIGMSSDDQQLVIKGYPPASLTKFVEVIGVAESNQAIRAEVWSNFGEDMDMQNYNQICLLANGEYKHLFI